LKTVLGRVAVIGAVAIAACVYFAASTTAARIASTLSVQETRRHARVVRLEAAVTRAFAERRAAQARCARLGRDERDECAAVANRLQILAIREGSVR
jgi:hypothetical protein